MGADVSRFIEAQNNGGDYERGLAEIRNGKKTTHWIWYVLPQVRELGRSERALYYGIASEEEVRAYLADPTLNARLIEITEAFLALDPPAEDIVGDGDALKTRSCMTLFEAYSDNPVFTKVLEKFYNGERCEKTLEVIEGWKQVGE